MVGDGGEAAGEAGHVEVEAVDGDGWGAEREGPGAGAGEGAAIDDGGWLVDFGQDEEPEQVVEAAAVIVGAVGRGHVLGVEGLDGVR